MDRRTRSEERLRFRLAHAKWRFDRIREALSGSGRGCSRRQTPGRKDTHADLVGRTWVTRRGIQVDRIASAWLIRRFVDPGARFRFIDIHNEAPGAGELTFDMMDADFTHEDDRCTFETLVRRTGIEDVALARVAEIIHDIDIKDGKFGRPEARGVEQLVLGLLAANSDDERRLDRGFAMLDDLYRSFGRQLGPAPPVRAKDQKTGKRKGGPR